MKWRTQPWQTLKATYEQQHMSAVILFLLLIVALELVKVPQMTVFLVIQTTLISWFPKEIWEDITWLGDFRVLLCLLAPLLIIRSRALVAILIATPLASLTSVSLKTLFDTRRPFEVLYPLQTELAQAAGNSSFPSGHSLTVAAFAAVIYAIWVAPQHVKLKKLAGITVLAILCLSVMCSRIALEAHWPLDVLAGAAVGWWVGSLACMLTQLNISQTNAN